MKVGNKKSKIIVSCFYCQPSRNKNKYLDLVEEVLAKNGDLLQLVADGPNIDELLDKLALLKRLKNRTAAHYSNLISLTEATRATATSSSCIDAIFGNVPLLKSTNEKTAFYDHYSCYLKMDLEYEAMECIYCSSCYVALENDTYK